MTVPKYKVALIGLWLIWIAIFLMSQLYQNKLSDYFVGSIGILFLCTSFYLWGISKYKNAGYKHPLFDEKDISVQPTKIHQDIKEESISSFNIEWKPWEHIPDRGEDQIMVEMWCKGETARIIGNKVFKKPETVLNNISYLRKNYPEARIPKATERKFLRIQNQE